MVIIDRRLRAHRGRALADADRGRRHRNWV